MALSFSIGIYILRSLLAYDPGLYAVYSLVTVGLATGVMLRESVRAALVSAISKSLISVTSGDQQKGMHDALTISIIVAIINVLISILLSSSVHFLNMSEIYKSQFTLFMILRSLGYAAVIVVIPYMNVLAFKNRMVAYNVFLLFERCVDLVAVELLLYLLAGDHSDTPLIHAASVYVIFSGVVSILLILYTKYSSGHHLTFKPSKPSIPLFLSIKQNIIGSMMLVINMAMYFRFSLLLVNTLFGEIMGTAYAVSVQISSYLRQAIMGLVLGLDSRFSRKNRGQIRNASVSDVNEQLYVVLVPLVMLCSLATIYMDTLVGLATNSTKVNVPLISSLSSLFIVGVAIRGSSEIWMQLMISDSRIKAFAQPILLFSLLTPLVTIFASNVTNEYGIVIVAQWFVISMFLAHLCVVPYVLSKIAPQLLLTDLYKPIISGFFIAGLTIICSFFIEAKIFITMLIILASLIWCVALILYR